MKIELWGHEVSDAIKKHLNEKYGMDEECYVEDMYIERSNDDIMDTFNLHQYRMEGELIGNKWVVHNEYELDGVYLKRKKKGAKNFQYVKLDKSDCRDSVINEDRGNMILWVQDREGY